MTTVKMITKTFLMLAFCGLSCASSWKNILSGKNYIDHKQLKETENVKSEVKCPITRYRSLNGSCNNLQNPHWGMAETPYNRLLPSNYGDGISSLSVSTSGSPLPNARELSFKLFPERDLNDPVWSLITMQWGQIVTHDLSLMKDGISTAEEESTCCSIPGKYGTEPNTSTTCAAVPIPPNDPVHAARGAECSLVVRCTNSLMMGTTPSTVPAEQLTTVTAFMDLSLMYGNSDKQNKQIRAHRGGRLATVVRRGQEWPIQDKTLSLCGNLHSSREPCYLSGDDRIDQNTELTLLQVMLIREHNRIADTLADLNPHWDDETIFQETRRILIGVVQHINYYEWLPILLGHDNMVKKKLIYPDKKGYVCDYNATMKPQVLIEYASAAFRHFHSSIAGHLRKVAEDRSYRGCLRLSDWNERPGILEHKNNYDELVRGFTSQSQKLSNQYMDNEVTLYLFRFNNTYGLDLRTIDIQRGRDHGLGTYVQMRAFCGLSVPESFDDLLEYMSKENVEVLRDLYENVSDLDLMVAGALEYNVPGTLAGPTFICTVTEQFYRTRVGDRFFYENGSDKDISFTPEQLATIRNGNMARLLCDNSKNVRYMQPNAFKLIGKGNRLMRCDRLPSVNLTLWKENVV